MDATDLEARRPQRFAAGTAVLAGAAVVALLSVSCCIIPIGLTIIGLGGAWLSFLGSLAGHREMILIGASLVVAYLWLRMLWPKSATPRGRLGTTMTVTASLAVVLAWSAPLWEDSATSALLDIWAKQR